MGRASCVPSLGFAASVRDARLGRRSALRVAGGTQRDFTDLLACDSRDVGEVARVSEQAAFASWLPEVYQELHRLAEGALRGQDAHTLQPTALVNEVFLRFAKAPLDISDRGQVIALAARAMRSVLIDHARAKAASKRGTGLARVTFDENVADTRAVDIDFVALDAALNRLEGIDARQAMIVEMRYFAGFTIEETAAAIGASPATVKREAAMALAWLECDLAGDER